LAATFPNVLFTVFVDSSSSTLSSTESFGTDFLPKSLPLICLVTYELLVFGCSVTPICRQLIAILHFFSSVFIIQTLLNFNANCALHFHIKCFSIWVTVLQSSGSSLSPTYTCVLSSFLSFGAASLSYFVEKR